MRKSLFACYLFAFFLSCKPQSATVTIYNKADVSTDSIYFGHLKKTYEFIVKPGEDKKIIVDISGEKFIGEGGLFAYLYAKDKIFPVIFCSKGLTSFDVDKNVTYFFRNATREDDKLPVQPTEFDLFIKNLSGEKTDSITSDAQYRPNYKNE